MRRAPLVPPRIHTMWYVFMFAGLAILCVVVVLIRNAQNKSGKTTASPNAPHPHTHAQEDHARQERKRRRAQSKADRRKRH
jgi:hypothetical protein